MKVELYDELPVKRSNRRGKNLDIIEAFHAQPKPYAVLVLEEGDAWKHVESMYSCLRMSAERTGRPVKVKKRGNTVILEKVIKPE